MKTQVTVAYGAVPCRGGPGIWPLSLCPGSHFYFDFKFMRQIKFEIYDVLYDAEKLKSGNLHASARQFNGVREAHNPDWARVGTSQPFSH